MNYCLQEGRVSSEEHGQVQQIGADLLAQLLQLSRIMKPLLSHGLCLSLLLTSCACMREPIGVSPSDSSQEKLDQIVGRDDFSGLLVKAERRLAHLLKAGEVGGSFGVPSHRIPAPNAFWSMKENGIAVQWMERKGGRCSLPNHCNEPEASPIEKFVGLINPKDVESAVQWEVHNHGRRAKKLQSWSGHWFGSVTSSILQKPILHPVYAQGDGKGSIRGCSQGETDCIKFEIGDMNALSAEMHGNFVKHFVGGRCNLSPQKVDRSANGRISFQHKKDDCRGLNAGAMLITLINRLKFQEEAFVLETKNNIGGDSAWNQPIYKYTVNAIRELGSEEAALLVSRGRAKDYEWNKKAKGFMYVDVTLHWLSRFAQNAGVPSSDRSMQMLAVIELDKKPQEDDSSIIGGEYVSEIGAKKGLTAPPYVWLPTEVKISTGADQPNPWLKLDAVQTLLDLGSQPLYARESVKVSRASFQ